MGRLVRTDRYEVAGADRGAYRGPGDHVGGVDLLRVEERVRRQQVNAKAGTNTLTWKLPKSLKAGKYTLRLLYEGTVKASTKVKIAR